MELRVIGCHGGETPRHRTAAFVIDDTLAVDAGSLTSGLELDEQARLQVCLVSHAHLDHVRDLATLADNRCQMRAPPLRVAATAETIEILRRHFFNDRLWPDFTRLPCDCGTTIEYQELLPEQPVELTGKAVRAVLVDHAHGAAAFVIEDDHGALAYSGDTGPTNRLWEVLNQQRDLRALLMEVSFPNREGHLARVSGHHTPSSMANDLAKYRAPSQLLTLLHHIKPVFQDEVERECAALTGLNLRVLRIGDRLVL